MIAGFLPLWAVAALLIGSIQIALGAAAIWIGGVGAETTRAIDLVFVLVALVHAAVAVPLLLGGRRDPRAFYLAAAFLCTGSAFSLRPLIHVAERLSSFDRPFLALAAIRIEVFLPYFFWRFAADFPRLARFGRRLQFITAATRLSLILGLLLLVAGLAGFLLTGRPDVATGEAWLDLLDRAGQVYWPLLLLLIMGALLESASRIRQARIEERRRLVWLLVGLAVGLAPVVVVNGLFWLIPSFAEWARQPGSLRKIGLIAYPPILASPLIIGYSVLVEHALDVRLAVRKVIQYALVRYSMATLVAIPFSVLLIVLYVNRDRPLSEVFSGRGAVLLIAAAILGTLALAGRRSMAGAIDRLFFREQYDARQTLSSLVRASQSARDAPAFGNLLVEEVRRALHPRAACLLLRDPVAESYVATAGYARPLPVSADLIQRLAQAGKPIPVDLERSSNPLYTLPVDELEWLGDGGFRLLVPIVSTTGGVAGLLGLADKLSELPYSEEDRELLEAIATSAALTIENQALRTGAAASQIPSEDVAFECRDCGMIASPSQPNCGTCGSGTLPAVVPLTLAGKYEFVRRVGRGGMGIVYQAKDVALDRDVAIKTLPWVSPQHAQRLRREARAMASLSHPNLALIHAVESWHGTPLLVLEYLPGGSLAERLRRGPLPPRDAVELAQVMAGAIEYVHGRGILHRDIKPSNIGFTASGIPKLLDFGVAHLLEAARPTLPKVAQSSPPRGLQLDQLAGQIEDPTTITITIAGELVGTPLYLPPEAFESSTPTPAFDLWSLCIVVYEAIAGENPFNDENPAVVVRRIIACEIPDIRDYVPALPEATAAFFAQVLAKDPRKRPSTAGELRHLLTTIQAS